MTQTVSATTGTLLFWRSLFAAFPPPPHGYSAFRSIVLRDHEIPRNSAEFTKVFRENMRNFGKILPRNFAEFRRNSAKNCFISSKFVFREITRYPFRDHPSAGGRFECMAPFFLSRAGQLQRNHRN